MTNLLLLLLFSLAVTTILSYLAGRLWRPAERYQLVRRGLAGGLIIATIYPQLATFLWWSLIFTPLVGFPLQFGIVWVGYLCFREGLTRQTGAAA